jgi:hypothetical protein
MGRADFGRDIMASADRIGTATPVDLTHPDDHATINYTGGTTGKSKGAIRRHHSTAAMSVAVSADFEFPAVPRYLAAAPITDVVLRAKYWAGKRDRWDELCSYHNSNLMLRSRAQRGVSKHGQRYVWCPPFETRPTAAPQGEVMRSSEFLPRRVDTFSPALRRRPARHRRPITSAAVRSRARCARWRGE